MVNLGFRGDVILNNLLYRVFGKYNSILFGEIVLYVRLCDEIEWWGNWRILWDNEIFLFCYSEGYRWVVICSVKGLIDKFLVLKKCEV